ncbi:acyl-homoserine-lactone synthase [Chitinimonas naiadis]
MLHISSGNKAQIHPSTEHALAKYRHRIFVEELGWPLPAQGGLERDQFDHDGTVYVVAKDQKSNICGCGRLLTTTGTYLLESIFPHLVGEMPLPRSASVWELSRFAISPPPQAQLNAKEAWANTCSLMAGIVKTAIELGAQRLIAFSAVGNERLLKRMGVAVQRIAVPQLIDGKPVVAFWIDLDDTTQRSLGLTAPARQTAMASQPLPC